MARRYENGDIVRFNNGSNNIYSNQLGVIDIVRPDVNSEQFRFLDPAVQQELERTLERERKRYFCSPTSLKLVQKGGMT